MKIYVKRIASDVVLELVFGYEIDNLCYSCKVEWYEIDYDKCLKKQTKYNVKSNPIKDEMDDEGTRLMALVQNEIVTPYMKDEKNIHIGKIYELELML